MRRLLVAMGLVMAMATPAWAQLGAVPYVFTAGSTIRSSEVNALFSAIYANSLNRTGGTMTGTLTTLGVLPTTHNTSNLGTASVRYLQGFFDRVDASTGFRVNAGAGAGTVLRGDGTNYVASTLVLPNTITAGQIPYATGTNTIGSGTGLTFTAGLLGLNRGDTVEVEENDVLGEIVFSGYHTSMIPVVSMRVDVRGTPAPGDVQGRFVFSLNEEDDVLSMSTDRVDIISNFVKIESEITRIGGDNSDGVQLDGPVTFAGFVDGTMIPFAAIRALPEDEEGIGGRLVFSFLEEDATSLTDFMILSQNAKLQLSRQHDGYSAEWEMVRSRAGGAAVMSGDVLGEIFFVGETGYGTERAAAIIAAADGDAGEDDMPGRLDFLTTPDGSTTPTLAMRLGSNQSARFYGNLLNVSGNLMDSQSTPSVASGGSAIAGRDYAFSYTHTAMGTPAEITFGATWASAPICTTNSSQSAYATYISAVTTTSVTIGFLNATGGSPTVYVQCRGY